MTKPNILSLVLLGVLVVSASAVGIVKFQVTPTAPDWGDTFTPFTVSCSSQAWTQVRAASKTFPRVTFIQLETSSISDVCLSSTTTAGLTCAAATHSIQLSTVTYGLHSVELHTSAPVYCRSVGYDAGGLGRLKGYVGSDTGDAGGLP